MSLRARSDLRAWKRRVRLPQKDIAARLGISEAYLSQILHGVRVPGFALMVRIENMTGIPLRAWSEVNITPAFQTQTRGNAYQFDEISQ